MVQVNAKNENLIAREICVCNENGDKKLGQVLAVTPDLITLVDTDTGTCTCMCVLVFLLANVMNSIIIVY